MNSANSPSHDSPAALASPPGPAGIGECASLAILDQLLSGTLSERETDDLRRHLSGCPRCRTALDQLSEPPPLREFRSDCGDLAGAPVEQPELRRLLKGLSETPPIMSAKTTR